MNKFYNLLGEYCCEVDSETRLERIVGVQVESRS